MGWSFPTHATLGVRVGWAHALAVEAADELSPSAYRNLADSSRTLDQLTRAEARYDRQYNRALQRLLTLRTAPAKTPPGDIAA